MKQKLSKAQRKKIREFTKSFKDGKPILDLWNNLEEDLKLQIVNSKEDLGSFFVNQSSDIEQIYSNFQKILPFIKQNSSSDQYRQFVTNVLEIAAKFDNINFVELLLAEGAVITADYYNPALQIAIENSNIKIVQKLLDAGANVNSIKAIKTALEQDEYDILQVLLKNKNINYLPLLDNEKFLDLCANNPSFAHYRFKALEAKRIADKLNSIQNINDIKPNIINCFINKNSDTLLHQAANAGDAIKVKKLLDKGADPNIKISIIKHLYT